MNWNEPFCSNNIFCLLQPDNDKYVQKVLKGEGVKEKKSKEKVDKKEKKVKEKNHFEKNSYDYIVFSIRLCLFGGFGSRFLILLFLYQCKA